MLALRGGVVGNGGKSWMSAVEVIRVVGEDSDTGPVAGSVRSRASSRGRVEGDDARDVDLAMDMRHRATFMVTTLMVHWMDIDIATR